MGSATVTLAVVCLMVGCAVVMGDGYGYDNGYGYGGSYGGNYYGIGGGYSGYSGSGGYSGYGHGYGKRRSRTVVVPVPVATPVAQPPVAAPVAPFAPLGLGLSGLIDDNQNDGIFGGDGTGLLFLLFLIPLLFSSNTATIG